MTPATWSREAALGEDAGNAAERDNALRPDVLDHQGDELVIAVRHPLPALDGSPASFAGEGVSGPLPRDIALARSAETIEQPRQWVVVIPYPFSS